MPRTQLEKAEEQMADVQDAAYLRILRDFGCDIVGVSDRDERIATGDQRSAIVSVLARAARSGPPSAGPSTCAPG